MEQLFSRMKLPYPDEVIEFFSDGNDDYSYVLQEYYAIPCLNYGQLVKIRENGTLVGKEKRQIFGNPDLNEIETTDVENFNGILRERIGRLVRKTKCFAKIKRRLCASISVFQFYWNFINNYQRKSTPSMLEGITKSPWTWSDFLNYKLTIVN